MRRLHYVRPGENLKTLALKYYNDPNLWPQIYHCNYGIIADPNIISPGMRLTIPFLTPRLHPSMVSYG